jgi:hypothetical protein
MVDADAEISERGHYSRLAPDESKFVTGSRLVIGGGHTAQ